MNASAPGVFLSSTDPELQESSAGTSSRHPQGAPACHFQPGISHGASCLEKPAPPEPTPLGTAGPHSQRPSRFLMLLRASPGFYSPFPSPSESSFNVCPPPFHLFNTDFASHSSTTFHFSSVSPVLFSTPLSFFPLFSYLQSPLCLSALPAAENREHKQVKNLLLRNTTSTLKSVT